MTVDIDTGGRPPPPPAPATDEAAFLWELRKYPDNAGALLAGDPVLPVTYARRYKFFFYCNATAFVASVVIVNLLLAHSLSRRRWWLRALQAAMVLDQFGLMGAYAAGSCRELAMSAYVAALVGLVSTYVCAHVLLFMLLAVKNEAGLSTPGGFLSGSVDGDQTLRPSRFVAFFHFNTTAFVASLVVIMLLMSRTVTRHGVRSSAL
ncbi:hypothetical protein PR202_gb22623 [Eleusine coracana subsp. coracana]|uniref:PGG domain-containing protein n=1 Tax=Eleusine coracana subsp. coracana TaxID=191504 RepID=A0AAV5FG99_ELECO|nr:hypothetical protein PR202_gb22623 [Eleusine coracana subsp. coracana]